MENWGLSLTLYQMLSCLGTLVCCEQLHKRHGSGDKQGPQRTDTSVVVGVDDDIPSALIAAPLLSPPVGMKASPLITVIQQMPSFGFDLNNNPVK